MFKALVPPLETGVDAHAFRDALKLFASGVTVITARDEAGRVHGMTATAFSSLSLHPPLVLVAISRKSRCHAHVRREGRFGVSILADDQENLSRHFGGTPRLDTTPAFDRLGEAWVLDRALVQLSCRLEDVLDGGDHSIFTGFVTAALSRPGAPLVHFAGCYHAIAATPRP